jgi:hypothetical protein
MRARIALDPSGKCTFLYCLLQRRNRATRLKYVCRGGRGFVLIYLIFWEVQERNTYQVIMRRIGGISCPPGRDQ